jgi:cellobiose phosphorylase
VSAAAHPPATEAGAIMRVFTDPDTPLPEVHLLSNGRYHVMATHAGGGCSRWQDLAVTRWREDATCDDWGTFIYLRDNDSGRYWSSAHQPTLRPAEHYEAPSCRRGPNTGGGTRVSKPIPKSASRPRTTSRSVVSP